MLQFVHEHLNQNLRVDLHDIGKGFFAVDGTECIFEISSAMCSYSFQKSMLLPCSHIFAVQKKLQIELFDKNLCDQR